MSNYIYRESILEVCVLWEMKVELKKQELGILKIVFVCIMGRHVWHLRTNLPKEIMGFLDFPFHKGTASFVSHSEVLQYLNEYTSHFQLWDCIQVSTHSTTDYTYICICNMI